MEKRILVTGATGYIGGRLIPNIFNGMLHAIARETVKLR